MIFLGRMTDFKTALQLRHGVSHPTGPRQLLTKPLSTQFQGLCRVFFEVSMGHTMGPSKATSGIKQVPSDRKSHLLMPLRQKA